MLKAGKEASDKLQQDLNHAEGMVIGHLSRQPSDVESIPRDDSDGSVCE